MGRILKRVLREIGLADPEKRKELADAWRDVAGPEIAGETRVRGLRDGVLTVEVGSAPRRQELEVFQREELLAALRERLAGVHIAELRFTLV